MNGVNRGGGYHYHSTGERSGRRNWSGYVWDGYVGFRLVCEWCV